MKVRPSPTPRNRVARFASDTRAATAVEYGLIIALIVLVMLAGLKQVAGGTSGLWADINSKVVDASR